MQHLGFPGIRTDKRAFRANVLAEVATAPNVPQQVWRIVSAIAVEVANQGHADLMLTGSLSNGTGDAVSDVDIELWCDSDASREELKRRVDSLLHHSGRVLSQFPATHIGLPQLSINFVEVDGVMVKVDVHYLLRDGKAAPTAGTCLVGTEGTMVEPPLRALPESSGSTPEAGFYGDLYSKFCGWVWYAHTKIVRGEFWEAEDAIGVMRTRALLPFLFLLRDLPSEGCRRLEMRLTKHDLQQLDQTRPHDLRPESIRSALKGAIDLLERLSPDLDARLGAGFRSADLGRIRVLTGL